MCIGVSQRPSPSLGVSGLKRALPLEPGLNTSMLAILHNTQSRPCTINQHEREIA